MTVRAATIEAGLWLARDRLADYFALSKPRIVAMVLVTTLAGYYLGAHGRFDFTIALNLVVGTAIAAGGTLALNQYFERELDAMMERTRRRPLPDGRLRPVEALIFGFAATAAGLAFLLVAVNLMCAFVTAAISVVYLAAYTPLKRASWLCSIVGAVPGALPPVAGWVAARAALDAEPLLMFAIMFLWQVPHTLAIGTLWRDDFARAGVRMLPPDTSRGSLTAPLIVATCIALIVMSVLPALLGYAGAAYLIVATALGAAMLGCAIAMVRAVDTAAAARRVLFASLIYLPVVLLVLVLDQA
ncbi:MAG: heme o synthase [Candidatus Binataceae bacterium]